MAYYVPIVDNALHHHVSFSQLWQQYNENRMLAPFLLVMVVGGLTHLNDLALIYLGAAFLVAGYFLLLMIYPRYSGKAITPVQTLLLGVLWFSIVNTQSALYAFQLGWLLVVLCLMVLLFLLACTPVSPPVLGLAMLVCVVASFSSLQGLFLWPVGLICLLWRVRTRRKLTWSLSLWVAAALVTTFIYFLGFKFGLRRPAAARSPMPSIICGRRCAFSWSLSATSIRPRPLSEAFTSWLGFSFCWEPYLSSFFP